MPGRKVGEEGLVGVLAVAQDHQLLAQVQQALRHALDQVHPFMAHQPGDHGDDGAAVRLEAELLAEGLLAGRLAGGKVGGVVMGGDVRVGGGVVADRVDAVEDAAQLILLLPQKAVQPVAEPGVQDLARVGGADRADPVAAFDGALHKVGAAVVLHHMGVPPADAAGVLQDVQAVLALFTA